MNNANKKDNTLWVKIIYKGAKIKKYMVLVSLSYTLRSVNDVTEGSTQEAHMCASCVLPRKVEKMV